MATKERLPKALLMSVSALLSMGTLACGSATKSQENLDGLARSMRQGQTASVSYPAEYTRRITVHSPTRDAHGTQEIDDYCDSGRYYRHDPESPHYETRPDARIHGVDATKACRDDVLTQDDPFPVSQLPN